MSRKNRKELLLVIAAIIGAVIVVSIFFIENPKIGDFFRTTLDPVATVVIGFCVALMTWYSYQQKTRSEFVVNYAVGRDGDISAWDADMEEILHPFDYSDITTHHMDYVSKIYIRNEKDKKEAIQKIFLRLSNNIVLPLKNYGNNPLLLESFDHTIETLDPTTYYYVEGDAEDNHYVVDWGKKGRDMLYDKKNEIIIQTEERLHYIKPNIKLKKHRIKKSVMLTRGVIRYSDIKILAYDVEFIYSIVIEGKPSTKDLEIVSTTKKRRNLLEQAEEFGIQLVMIRNSGEYSASYYFLSKNKKKYAFGVSPTWWKEFEEKHKSFLQTKIINKSYCKDLIFYFNDYLKTKNVKIMERVSWFSFNPKSPKSIQEVLAKKKPNLIQRGLQRLRKPFSRKEKD